MRLLIISSICGVCGIVMTFLFGVWGHLLTLFMVAIAIDYISGIAASLKQNKGLSSKVGFWGLAKKGLMLLIVTLAHHMDMLFGTSWIKDGTISFYLANELISITENYARLGLPLPPKVKNIIASLKSDSNDQNKS